MLFRLLPLAFIPFSLALPTSYPNVSRQTLPDPPKRSTLEKGNHILHDVRIFASNSDAQNSWIDFIFEDACVGYEIRAHCNGHLKPGANSFNDQWFPCTRLEGTEGGNWYEGDQVNIAYNGERLWTARRWDDPSRADPGDPNPWTSSTAYAYLPVTWTADNSSVEDDGTYYSAQDPLVVAVTEWVG